MSVTNSTATASIKEFCSSSKKYCSKHQVEPIFSIPIIPKSLAKREIKGVDARIEEFDLEGSVYDGTFLPDELVEAGLANFAGAIRGGVRWIRLTRRPSVPMFA